MMNFILSLLVALPLLISVEFNPISKPPIVVKNPITNKSDYVSKTYIDANGDGQYDHIRTVWAKGKITNSTLTVEHDGKADLSESPYGTKFVSKKIKADKFGLVYWNYHKSGVVLSIEKWNYDTTKVTSYSFYDSLYFNWVDAQPAVEDFQVMCTDVLTNDNTLYIQVNNSKANTDWTIEVTDNETGNKINTTQNVNAKGWTVLNPMQIIAEKGKTYDVQVVSWPFVGSYSFKIKV